MFKLILGGNSRKNSDRQRPLTPTETKLLELYRAFGTRHSFAPGDIVRWKPGLQIRMSPGPFVVLEVLETPRFDMTEKSSSCVFREPLDIVVGRLDKDGDMILSHLDSRRLEPVPEADL